MDTTLYLGLAFLYGVIFIIFCVLCCCCCFIAIFKRQDIDKFFSAHLRNGESAAKTTQVDAIEDTGSHIYHKLEDQQQDSHIYKEIDLC